MSAKKRADEAHQVLPPWANFTGDLAEMVQSLIAKHGISIALAMVLIAKAQLAAADTLRRK